MPNGLPLGFPIRVDSANRCYRNINQSSQLQTFQRGTLLIKINLFCEDMKSHLPSWPLLQITALGKEVNGNRNVLIVSLLG